VNVNVDPPKIMTRPCDLLLMIPSAQSFGLDQGGPVAEDKQGLHRRFDPRCRTSDENAHAGIARKATLASMRARSGARCRSIRMVACA
jgi:hypothetical protein